MEAFIDSVGRIVIPKPLRNALGFTPGSTVDISRHGAGLLLVPTGRTAQLVEEFGVLVATGDIVIDDDDVFGLVDTGRGSGGVLISPDDLEALEEAVRELREAEAAVAAGDVVRGVDDVRALRGA